MPLSPSKRGYRFQHRIKDIFVALGFEGREEDPTTRTDICLTHSPIDLAVECKHLEGGVSSTDVEVFDTRLKKLWENGRPSMGIMVGTSFQSKALEVCKAKNILCLTEAHVEAALVRKKNSMPSTSIPISSRLEDLLRALEGLFNAWYSLLYGDPAHRSTMLFNSLLRRELVVIKENMGDGYAILHYSNVGADFFKQCKRIYVLLSENELKAFDDESMISECIYDVLREFDQERYSCYDKMMLLALGIICEAEGRFVPSCFANTLLDVLSEATTKCSGKGIEI